MNVGKVIDINKMNLYFADFYCNEMGPQDKEGARQGCLRLGIKEENGKVSSSVLHYLTIVVCPKGSSVNE